MSRLSRTSVVVGIAVLAVIAGLSHLLTGAAPPAAAQPKAPEARVEFTADAQPKAPEARAEFTADAQPKAPEARAEFTADGKLKRPVGYRTWVYVGTPLTPNDLNGGEAMFPEFHSVYVDPESFAHYEKTGEFRDGTVVVKELSSVGSKEAVSGKGYFMGELTGLDTAIKDSKRFKDEPGHWAYFSFGHKYPLKAEAAKNAAAACNRCHQDNAKKDWVFTQYYPVLRAAAPKSK